MYCAMSDEGGLTKRFAQSAATVKHHRQALRTLEQTGSDASRRGLDWFNFFLADVQTGFGAFVAFYLASMSWSQQDVGFVLTIGTIVGAVGLLPGGALADETRWKRALAAAGVLMIASAALILALWPDFTLVIIAEILHGMTAGIIGPAVASISLGIVGQRALSCRTGRNQRFQGAGNAATAILFGLLGSFIAKSTIFFATAGLTIPALVALSFVRSDEIDYARARNATKEQERPHLRNILDVVKNKGLLWFACCAAMFQFADASLLPLASEGLAGAQMAGGALLMSGLVVAPQLVVAFLSPWVGYFSEMYGRKAVLLVGFAVQIIRAGLFAFVSNPILMIFIQLLDGISGAILTVLTVVIVADLTTGTGRFNLASGTVGLIAAIAASLSTAASGFIAQHAGRSVAFLGMAALAVAGTLLVWFALPETKPEKYVE